MKFSSEFGGVIKTRTLHEEEQWDTEFAKFVKGESRQVVPGINSGHVPAAISDRTGVCQEKDQPMLVWDNRTKLIQR